MILIFIPISGVGIVAVHDHKPAPCPTESHHRKYTLTRTFTTIPTIPILTARAIPIPTPPIRGGNAGNRGTGTPSGEQERTQMQALYRFYDHDDQLLYVGITMNPAQRWLDHRNQKPWWLDVAKITVDAYPDRAAVLAAEHEAIKVERPVYNIQHRLHGASTWRNTDRSGALCATTPEQKWSADDMPDGCHDYCEDEAIYLPYRWADGCGQYRCRLGHRWTCCWGHNGSGSALEHFGTPIWTTAA